MAVKDGFPDEVLGGLYPFEDRTVMLDDGTCMHYVERGRAGLRRPTFLLLHGNPTWSFLYRGMIGPLSKAGRVVAMDHVGFGRSDHPTDPSYHTLDRHVANLEEAVGKLGLKRVVPVLHGWGGPIGLGYATRRPKDVAGLVLVNTWASTSMRLPLASKALRVRGAGEWSVKRRGRPVEGIPRLARRGLAPEVMEGYRHPFPDPASRQGVLAFARMVLDRPGHPSWATLAAIEAALPGLDVPARILWGVHDPILGREQAEALHAALPQAAPPEYLDEAGHLPQEDVPEVLVDRIRDFVTRL